MMFQNAESKAVLVDEQSLTERQRSVMTRIDRRVPIKLIAQELGVSETRINQHIRILKDIYQVASLNELVEVYRRSKPPGDDDLLGLSDNTLQLGPGETATSNVFPLRGSLPQEIAIEPTITPGILNGENAALFRLAAIVGIAFGIIATVVLLMTAASTLGEVMKGWAYISVDRENTG